MAVFKKFENQEVRKIEATVAADLNVGDIVAFDPTTEALAEIVAESGSTIEAAIQTAMAAGKEIYIIAQGDMITYNEPTDYKTYIIEDVVKASESKKIVAGYLVKSLSNVEA